MSQHQAVGQPAARPAQPSAQQTQPPGYLQQRVAFPAPTTRAAHAPRVITQPGRTRGVGRDAVSRTSTPRLLAALMALVTLALLLLGTVATAALVDSAEGLRRASHNAQQLVRVQQVEAQLLRADALATNAFLVGGLESAESRAQYDAAVAEASRLLVAAGTAQPADAAALEVVSSELVAYSTTMAQARANNRQGFPVGATYLDQASSGLRERAVPALEAMAAANAERVRAETGNASLVAVVLVAAACLAALGWTMWTVAHRFRRTVNVGLATATALALLASVAGVAVLAREAQVVADLDRGALNGVRQLSAARTGAYDAKALESLTLVARGSGAAYEESWAQQHEAVSAALQGSGHPQLQEGWQAYASAHQEVRALDDSGDWDAAVAAATSSGPDSTNAALTGFQEQLATALEADVDVTGATLQGQRTGLWITAVAVALASLGAVAAALAGLQTRRREYE